jgi:phosphatidylserine/phosphatidylglycerophosphate/cardiolipin synthase-like enzyme
VRRRVAQAYFGDGLIDKNGVYDARDPATRLIQLDEYGCDVRVLVHRSPTTGETNLGVETRRGLCDHGIPVRSIEKLHHKFVISSGSYEGAANSPQVLMGSHNMTLDALRYNDEVLMRIKGSNSTYDLYKGHWDDMWQFSQGECAWND